MTTAAELANQRQALIDRLPLPLVQLYNRLEHSPQKLAPLKMYHRALEFWEAALKLLAATAVAEFARLDLDILSTQNRIDRMPARLEKIKAFLACLSQPSIGHWWGLVQALTPFLADAGDESFQVLNNSLFDSTHNDMPAAAELDLALRKLTNPNAGLRKTVKLRDLFDQMIRLRNKDMAHGAPGQRSDKFYADWSRVLVPGLVETMARVDVLAGRTAVYVSEVSRRPDGSYAVERYKMMGAGENLSTMTCTEAPLPKRIYLSTPHPSGKSTLTQASSLHPLIVFDVDKIETQFWNGDSYLNYNSGDSTADDHLVGEMRLYVARLLGAPQDAERLAELARHAAVESPPQSELPVADEEPLDAAAPLRLGDFERISTLGAGAMGVVYRARQISMGREVALKVLKAPSDKERFEHEIRAMGQAKHPNLVEIYANGSDGDNWFFAMELVEGATLAAIGSELESRLSTVCDLDLKTWDESVQTGLKKSRESEHKGGGPQNAPPPALQKAPAPDAAVAPSAVTAEQCIRSVTQGAVDVPTMSLTYNLNRPLTQRIGVDYIRRIVELIRQVAEAAHALHEKGVIHRDIKPGNIMITPDGAHAKLMDLGLAKLASQNQRLTKSRDFLGTVPYASPEQVHSAKAADHRADIYALGVSLWELLTFRPIYDITKDVSPHESSSRILFRKAGSIRTYNRQVSRDLDDIVAKCLEKEPKDRYTTAQELAEDLQRYLNDEPPKWAKRGIRGQVKQMWRSLKAHPKAMGIACLALVGLGMAWHWCNTWLHERRISAFVASVKRGNEKLDQKEYAQAEAHFTALISDPETWEARIPICHARLGAALAGQNKWEAALLAFKKAESFTTTEDIPRQELEDRGIEWDQAAYVFSYHILYGKKLLNEDPAKAERHFREIINGRSKWQAGVPVCYAYLAAAIARGNNWESASKELQKAESYFDSKHQTGMPVAALEKQNNWDPTEIIRGIRAHKYQVDVVTGKDLLKGEIETGRKLINDDLSKAENWSKAENFFKLMTQKGKWHSIPIFHAGLGHVHVKQKKWNLALAAFEQADAVFNSEDDRRYEYPRAEGSFLETDRKQLRKWKALAALNADDVLGFEKTCKLLSQDSERVGWFCFLTRGASRIFEMEIGKAKNEPNKSSIQEALTYERTGAQEFRKSALNQARKELMNAATIPRGGGETKPGPDYRRLSVPAMFFWAMANNENPEQAKGFLDDAVNEMERQLDKQTPMDQVIWQTLRKEAEKTLTKKK